MHLCYFDENKHGPDSPHFLIGGVVIPQGKALQLDEGLSRIAGDFFGARSLIQAHELHGKDLFHGKGNARGRSLGDRVRVFQEVASLLVECHIPIRLVCIDVPRHMRRYKKPSAPYRLGMMLFLERIAEYLDGVDDLGLVFGDYEADEMGGAVVDFSEYKARGRTPMSFGRPLARLIDTVYFTQSHHSRFLQVADLLVYMAGRYGNGRDLRDSWHEQQVRQAWETIKASGDLRIQRWP